MAVETVEALDPVAGGGDHVVQFYEHDAQLVDVVGPYLIAAIEAGEVAIVIATKAHREAFEQTLRERGIDPSQAIADGRLVSLDALSTMDKFISAGEIDRSAFFELARELLRESALSGRAIRAYGEMVALLWEDGNVLAAIELEGLWNELARELSFSLFCAYPAASVAGAEHAEALQHVCHLHSAVIERQRADHEAATGSLRERELTASFPAETDAPGCARRLLVETLERWGHGGTLVDDAALVLSELASNAVLHAGSSFSIEARMISPKTLRLCVCDSVPLAGSSPDGGLIPRPMHGLSFIDVLAARWGVENTGTGKMVWAELLAVGGR